MRQIRIANFSDFLIEIGKAHFIGKTFGLYRGQSNNDSLLPSIARKNPNVDSKRSEKKMIDEFRRSTQMLISENLENDWGYLVYAQHFGLKTRLLDWTSNPLIALWYACRNKEKLEQASYVYLFIAHKSDELNKLKDPSPWTIAKTKILRPPLNNKRVIAQAGWFTAHKYSNSANRFVPLGNNKNYKDRVVEFTIPGSEKSYILKRLNEFGINNQSLYPDVEGVCRHINWEFKQ